MASKSRTKSVAAKKPQAARAQAPLAVKASSAPKVAVPSDVAAGFAFTDEIAHPATPVPPLSSKARARAKRAEKPAVKAAQAPSSYAHPAGGLFADAEAEAKAASGAKAARSRKGAAAAAAKPTPAEGGYVDEAKRALKTAKVSLADVIESIPPIPWSEWRQRLGAGLGSTLVQTGKWLADRGLELARQAEAAAAEAEAKASTLAEQHPDADAHEQQA